MESKDDKKGFKIAKGILSVYQCIPKTATSTFAQNPKQNIYRF